MPATAKAPTAKELTTMLGPAEAAWTGLIEDIGGRFVPLDLQWRPSKSEFGRIGLLQHKKRTLVYLTPQKEEIAVAIILGERAYELAMTSAIPNRIKQMFRAARPYAEGRGIRFPAKSMRDVAWVAKLIEIKTTPK